MLLFSKKKEKISLGRWKPVLSGPWISPDSLNESSPLPRPCSIHPDASSKPSAHVIPMMPLYMHMNEREARKAGRQDILCFIAVSAPLFEEQAGIGHMCLASFQLRSAGPDKHTDICMHHTRLQTRFGLGPEFLCVYQGFHDVRTICMKSQLIRQSTLISRKEAKFPQMMQFLIQ